MFKDKSYKTSSKRRKWTGPMVKERYEGSRSTLGFDITCKGLLKRV